MRKGSPWSEECVARMLKLLGQGRTHRQIAEVLCQEFEGEFTERSVGVKIGGYRKKRYPSVTKPKSDKKHETKVRKCLKCRNEFKSSWAGERVCGECKSRKSWKQSNDFSLGAL